MKILVSAIIIYLLFTGFTKATTSCSNSFIDNYETKDTTVYAYVTSIKKDSKGVLLFVDFIQFYSNEEAIAKAKERGDADTVYKNGKMVIGVPGDYYIINDSRALRKFYLSNNVNFKLLLNQDRQHPITENNLNSFIKIYNDSPFIVHISGNKIVSIVEVFLP